MLYVYYHDGDSLYYYGKDIYFRVIRLGYMSKKIVLGVAIVACILVLTLATIHISNLAPGKSEQTQPSILEILNKSKSVVEKLNNFRASVYSTKYQHGCEVVYEFRLDVVDSKRIIRFEDLKYNCSNSIVYKRLKIALTNATLVDTGEFYYLHTPAIKETEGMIMRYKPMNSILRYRSLPIIDCVHITDTFKRASNVKFEGEKVATINDKTTKVKVISYELADGYTGKVNVIVWINEDYIPVKVKAEFADYNVIIESGVKSYEFGNAEDFDMSGYEIFDRFT